MEVLMGLRYKMKPTAEQKQKLAQLAGNDRFIYNWCIDINKERYEKEQKFYFANDLINMLPELKEQEGYEFLKESFSQSLQTRCRIYDVALRDGIKGIREFPKYKKKKFDDSFTCPQKWRVEKKYVFIPKVGEVKWIKHKPLKGRPKTITISQEGDDWYCAVLCVVHIKASQKPDIDTVVGVDWGISTLLTDSDGTTYKNPKNTKKYEKKLARAQKKLSKKKYKSKNYTKQLKKVRKIQSKVANSRKDAIHKATTSITKNSGGVAVENTGNANMMKNHRLAKSIQDVSPHEIKRQFKYKCRWQGKYYVEIDRFEPTSKTCSNCGSKQDMPLSKRTYVCSTCGMVKDRDMNAALNIRRKGIEKLQQETTVGHTGIACGVKGSKTLTMNQEKYYLEATG